MLTVVSFSESVADVFTVSKWGEKKLRTFSELCACSWITYVRVYFYIFERNVFDVTVSVSGSLSVHWWLQLMFVDVVQTSVSVRAFPLGWQINTGTRTGGSCAAWRLTMCQYSQLRITSLPLNLASRTRRLWDGAVGTLRLMMIAATDDVACVDIAADDGDVLGMRWAECVEVFSGKTLSVRRAVARSSVNWCRHNSCARTGYVYSREIVYCVQILPHSVRMLLDTIRYQAFNVRWKSWRTSDSRLNLGLPDGNSRL